ncbi:MAG: hypothetical protein STSR0009_24170 [Methanoregula sp.]
MDLHELLEDNRGGILALAKKHGIIGMDITGSDAGCDVFESGGVEFLIEFAPDAPLVNHEEFQQDLLLLLGKYVELASSEAIDRHLRRIVIKEAAV